MTKKQNTVALCSALLLSALLLAGSGERSKAAGTFTPACAERDLRAIATIEQLGEIEEMSSAWLGAAGLSLVQARIYCLADREADGIALYDRIIAGDVRLLQLAANEPARAAR